MKKEIYKAFTLAEVLITLGIVGVVAALTLPTLVQNYKKHVVETKLAKFYTTINQAVARSNAQNGDPADWVKDCGGGTNPTCTTEETIEWFKTYIGQYMSVSKIEPIEGTPKGFLVYFNDGSIMFMKTCIYDIYFYISEKAIKNPTTGINRFHFRFMPKIQSGGTPDVINRNQYTIKNTVEPYLYEWDGTIEHLYTELRYSCSNGGQYCTKIIQLNGWKIPKDYPLKF